MTNCMKCGRPLKNPKSMEHGYGPECWSKIAAGIKKERTDSSANRSDYAYHINASPDNRKVMADFRETPDTMWCEGKNYKEA